MEARRIGLRHRLQVINESGTAKYRLSCPQGMRGFLFAERKLTIEGENAMYLYNSATHKKEEFRTHTPGHVEMYTCGPTVYHFAHIGNLRSYIMEDVLEKYPA